MLFQKFFIIIQFMFGLSLVFSCVLPLDVIVLNTQLADKLSGITQYNAKLLKRKCSDSSDDEYDDECYEEINDSWETYDIGCHCVHACDCKTTAIVDIAKLERSIQQTSDDDNDCINPFGFDDIEEINASKKAKLLSPASSMHDKENKDRRTSTKRKVQVLVSVVQNDLRSVHCCTKSCLKYIPLETAVECRVDFWKNKSQSDQRNFMISEMRTCENGNKSRRFFRIPSCEQLFCQKAWCTVYGIKDTRYKDTLKLVKEGVLSVGGKRDCLPTRAFFLALRWFKQFAFMCDVMPTTGLKHLPACLSKRSIHMLYTEEMNRKGETEILSRAHFIYRMWKREFPNVRIPKHSRFTKCTICVHLKSQLLNPRLNKEERLKLINMRKVHLMQQMAERRNYYLHGMKAKDEPHKYLSLILDGMDQNKTRLPHITERTKVDDGLWKLKTHITGILVNARSRAYNYIDICEYAHDPNLTIQILLNVLHKEQSKIGQLPPVLYLQMDNCGRENKNTAVISFLGLLVKLDIFKKVRLGFLVVGHTHEDIDQMFSCVSRKLLKKCAMTLEDLSNTIRESYSPSPEVYNLECVYDAKTWMQPCIQDLSGHSEPHQFKIEKDDDGVVRVMYRKWSTSKEWKFITMKESEEPISMFESTPSGAPPQVAVDSMQMLSSMTADIPKYGCILSEKDQVWWQEFLRHTEERQNSEGKEVQGWGLGKLKKQKVDGNSLPVSLLTEDDEKVHSELDKRFNKERREPKVTLKKGRKNKTKSSKSSKGGQ